MPEKKKPTKKVKQVVKQPVVKPEETGNKYLRAVKNLFRASVSRSKMLSKRRPHRSFKRTYRRDYARSFKLPGYWAFTNYVRKAIWQHKKLFFGLLIIYGVLTASLLGLASQDTYTQLSDTLRQTSGEVFKGNWGQLGKAGLLLATGVMGDLNTNLTEAQQIYAVIVIFFTWLTTVWLLRALQNGRRPRLRDALYNAGAPILPTFMVGLLLVVQLLPVIVGILALSALTPYGVFDGGVESMIFWFVEALLALLSLYWITSTFFALIVVTLPGKYPMEAIQAAGDLVVGRRLRIMFRMIWLLIVTALGWCVVMVPLILLDAWIKGIFPIINWVPTVPIGLLVMGTVTTIWAASYIYLFYRKVVDDDAAPA